MSTDLDAPIKAFYIIGFSAWRLPAGALIYDCFDFDFDTDDDEVLVQIDTDGDWTGSYSVKRCQPVLSDFWTEKVISCYLNRSYTTHGGYGVLKMLVTVEPTSLDAILEHDRYELLKQVDELFASFEPKAKFVRAEQSGKRPKYPRVFYLQLERQRSYAAAEYLADVLRLAEQFRQRLNPKSVILPHLLADTLLLPGPSPSGVSSDIVALGLVQANLKLETTNLVIAKTVSDVVEYMIAIYLMKDLVDRLNDLRFLSRSLGEYTNAIQITNLLTVKKRPWRDRAKRQAFGNISDSYEYEFLVDRVHSSLERDIADVTLSSIQDILALNRVANWERWPLSHFAEDGTLVEKSQIRLCLPEQLVSEFSQQLDGIKRKRNLLNSREQALADFLRDLASASSARANLRLQRSVWLLTRIATFFALFGLGISLLTDERKRTIGNAILRFLRMHSG